MNNKKLIIPILIVLILLFLIVNVILILFTYKYKYSATPSTEIKAEIKEKLEPVATRNNYYAVKNCVTKFYTYYNMIYITNNSISNVESAKKKNIEAVYNMLDKEYITYKNITMENLTIYLPQINKVNVDITNMYVSQKNENISIYFVYGNLIDISSNTVSQFSMIVKVDMLNRTFKILLEDYIEEKYPNMNPGYDIEINYEDEITNDTYNTFGFKYVDDETYIKDVVKSLKNNMLYNSKVAYERLNEQYRAKRFPTLEDFEKYIKNKMVEISLMKLAKYQKNVYDDYIQYICVDDNNNYYIINEYSTLNYNYMLDRYSSDLPQFAKEYEEATDIEKVGLNIEKLGEAINEGDIKYIYNKLDDTYKKNYFNNYSDFENYLKSNLFERNSFKYENIEKRANVYSATIIVENKKDYTAETRKINIIMKLTDKTDFYISFSLEN